jgi:exopolysaccharide biosynthesis protein
MRFIKKPPVWAVSYTILLILFTFYVALDTFVIPRAYAVVDAGTAESVTQSSETAPEATSGVSVGTETGTNAESGTNESTVSGADISSGESSVFTSEAVITDSSYSDENISITITEYREYDTSIYVADIYLSSIDYLKTAFADNTYGKNITEKTSAIAAAQNAILAINGDFYGAQSKGYVIRNGTIYRDTPSDSSQEDLVIYSDGSFDIVTEGSTTASELLDNGALQVLSFGPSLLDNGEITVTNSEEVDKAMTSNPRTAIGIIDNLHYVMVVSDGRTSASTGLTLYQLATFMQNLGVTTAYNLDGGGSSTMYFNGTIINNPTTNGKKITERSVSDIVYIG